RVRPARASARAPSIPLRHRARGDLFGHERLRALRAAARLVLPLLGPGVRGARGLGESLLGARHRDVVQAARPAGAPASHPARGRYTLQNRTGAPVDHLHLYLNPDVTVHALLPAGGVLDMADDDLGYRVYRLDPPLPPGAKTQVSYDLAIENRGFVNNGSRNQIVYNGTFFDSFDFFPHVGYVKRVELDDPNERRRRDLPPVQRFPKIGDAAAHADHYLSSEA